jgi:hypothetical protein
MGEMIIGVILGAVIGFASTIIYDSIKEARERRDLAKIIYIDVQNNLTTLYTFLKDLSFEESKKHDFINASDFDTRIFEAYLQKIPVLSSMDAARVLSFYGELSKANEAMHMLKDKTANLSPEGRRHWMEFFYEKIYKSTRNGRRIMSDLEVEYKIKPLGTVKETMDACEKYILEKNPALKNKIIIPEGKI